jgi:hypothetical protein
MQPLFKTTVLKTIAQSLTAGAIAGGLLFTSANITTAQAAPVPQQAKADGIDFYTDHFFYAANPELNKRKLRSGDRGYIQEWNAIRQAIAPLVKSSTEVCFRGESSSEAFWEVDLNFNQNGGSTYDYLADVIFYHRNPEWAGKKLRTGTPEARQWSAIRDKMFVHSCGI